MCDENDPPSAMLLGLYVRDASAHIPDAGGRLVFAESEVPFDPPVEVA